MPEKAKILPWDETIARLEEGSYAEVVNLHGVKRRAVVRSIVTDGQGGTGPVIYFDNELASNGSPSSITIHPADCEEGRAGVTRILNPSDVEGVSFSYKNI